jgi:hypothetical protein
MKIKPTRRGIQFNRYLTKSGKVQEIEVEGELTPVNDVEIHTNKSTKPRRHLGYRRISRTGLGWRKFRDQNACLSFSELDELQPPKRFR